MGRNSGQRESEKTFSRFEAEFNKIIWPDKDTVGKRTVAVIACTVALGLIIALPGPDH